MKFADKSKAIQKLYANRFPNEKALYPNSNKLQQDMIEKLLSNNNTKPIETFHDTSKRLREIGRAHV